MSGSSFSLPAQPRCRIGDLAVVVKAANVDNLGRIVRVERLQSEDDWLVMDEEECVWFVRCSHLLTWTIDDEVFRNVQGPVPDSCLHPIRGEGPRKAKRAKASRSTRRERVRAVPEPVAA